MWDVRYEALREEWLGGRVTGGVVLVLRQGLLAWVRAEPVARPPAGGSAAPAATDRALVSAFVELILNRRPEGPS